DQQIFPQRILVEHDTARYDAGGHWRPRKCFGVYKMALRGALGGVSLGSEADIGAGAVDAAKQADEYAAFRGSRRCHFVRNDDSRRRTTIF
ncbi:hypothetical protein OFL48_11065, partial [Pseudomonas aeruginosa]|uniref:hypothetical protein n=1 Tax=Pseudomonas aeruginosa TaxID=287 RepID=UPI0021F13425